MLDKDILRKLNEIGIALSKERNISILLEKILSDTKALTHADGGTIYTVTADKKLHFEIALSDSLGKSIPVQDLPLFLADGSYNDSLMVAYAVNHKTTINIEDAYQEEGFDFSGTRRFDIMSGYRTKAVLTIPIKNHEDDVIAVLQLINPKESDSFSKEDEQLAESIASQAGVALTNQLLIRNLRKLFESLIHVIAEVIDEKSPSTGNHSKRVPVVALMLAKAVSETTAEPFKATHFSDDDLYELEIAAFLHDCGKITTPDYVVEKKNKLDALFDRMELVKTRYKVLEQSDEKELLQKKLDFFELHYPKEFSVARDAFLLLEKEQIEKRQALEEELAFLQRCNEAQEAMTTDAVAYLKEIAQKSYGEGEPLLTVNELENLSILKGNLTQKEREIIQHHVVMTYRMLSRLQFPKELRRVPEIAASHHERVDGKGYPRGLKKDQMSLQARILVIGDIFEALSAPDRPYKKALPLSQVFSIMQQMTEEGHLDPDLFSFFYHNKVYLPYAKQYLAPEQLDI